MKITTGQPRVYRTVGWLGLLILQLSCATTTSLSMKFKETQLTSGPYGHTLYNTQVFSPDDQWIVFDTRNEDNKIGSTDSIGIVHTKTKELKIIYRTQNQTEFGPGVGAASFSPVENKVLFIHGIRNADKAHPYGFTRRTGVAVAINKPFDPLFMDARDVVPPFTPGALRGGTHAHTWSGDGRWISFTYNDYVIEQLSKKDSAISDLRTIGVMVPGKVQVREKDTIENHSGEMFSVVAVPVKESPVPGSDEVDKAFDEGWVGRDGYIRSNGSRQKRAIAFQGNTRNGEGKTIAEVFVADLPDDLTLAQTGKPLEGSLTTRPAVPQGISIRRITSTERGLEGPRFWLRSTPDGSLIAFLAKDGNGVIQIFGVSPNGGPVKQLTHHPFSIQGPFNFSPDGKYIAYTADNSIFITDLKTYDAFRLTPKRSNEERPVGAPIWSNKGNAIAFNRYINSGKESFLQIFLLERL